MKYPQLQLREKNGKAVCFRCGKPWESFKDDWESHWMSHLEFQAGRRLKKYGMKEAKVTVSLLYEGDEVINQLESEKRTNVSRQKNRRSNVHKKSASRRLLELLIPKRKRATQDD